MDLNHLAIWSDQIEPVTTVRYKSESVHLQPNLTFLEFDIEEDGSRGESVLVT